GATTSRPAPVRSTSTSATCGRRRRRGESRGSYTRYEASATSSASHEPMSLRWRIAATLGVVAALVMAFGAIAAYVSTSQRLEDSVDESLLARARDYAHFPGFPRSP